MIMGSLQGRGGWRGGCASRRASRLCCSWCSGLNAKGLGEYFKERWRSWPRNRKRALGGTCWVSCFIELL